MTPPLIPGEVFPAPGTLTLNANRPTVTLMVLNTGDRPVQVGSHYHFFEANAALRFDRAAAFGLRLDIPSGTAVRFEPSEEKEITLTTFAGQRLVLGLNGLTEGAIDDIPIRQRALRQAAQSGFLTATPSQEDPA